MSRVGLLLAAVAMSALVAGCGGGSNKAGGRQANAPRLLTIANGATDREELVPFADEVAHLSHGRLRIELTDSWRVGQRAFENGLIADVRAGKADLGWTGSRALDSIGARSFEALNAPFLIDSYPLEERVVRSAVVRPMLRSLEEHGLVGLGVLPGSLRRPFGVRSPLVQPADFAGLAIGVQQSHVADETMRALGARPVWIPIQGIDIRRLGGIEQRLSSIHGWSYDEVGRYLARNVNFWPRPVVLFANRKAFESLTADEQRVLRQAATNVIPAQLAFDRDRDREAGDDICRGGHVTFETASQADLAALRRVVQPVYDRLDADPATRRAIDTIERLKRASPAPPDALPACRVAGRSEQDTPTPVDGVWRMTSKFGDIPDDPDRSLENYGTWTYVFDRGRFAITQQFRNACTWGYGTFTVRRGEMAWTFTDGGGVAPTGAENRPGEFFRFGWSRYRDTLTLTQVKGAISPANFRARPWHLLSASPSRRYLSTRCPPPAAALRR
jgi:TRAP-type C4-dicarboxylate transport system substrate-binding protein